MAFSCIFCCSNCCGCSVVYRPRVTRFHRFCRLLTLKHSRPIEEFCAERETKFNQNQSRCRSGSIAFFRSRGIGLVLWSELELSG